MDMVTSTDVWLYLVFLPKVKIVCEFLGGLLGVISVGYAFIRAIECSPDSYDDNGFDTDKFKHYIKYKAFIVIASLSVIFGGLYMVIPTEKQIALMVAIPPIVNDQNTRDVVRKTPEVLNKYLDELLTEQE